MWAPPTWSANTATPKGAYSAAAGSALEDPPREKRIANQVAGRSEWFAVQAQKSTLIEPCQCHEPGRPEVRSNRRFHFSPRGVSHDKVERHEGVEKRDLLVEASPGGHKVVAALVRNSEGVLLGVGVHWRGRLSR